MKETYPSKISDDIAVPRSRMVELLDFAAEAAAACGVGFSAYGHLGDGNVHLNLLCKTPEERARRTQALQAATIAAAEAPLAVARLCHELLPLCREAAEYGNPSVASDAGVAAILQPGGSVRDADVIAACDRLGAAMVFTASRHFRH